MEIQGLRYYHPHQEAFIANLATLLQDPHEKEQPVDVNQAWKGTKDPFWRCSLHSVWSWKERLNSLFNFYNCRGIRNIVDDRNFWNGDGSEVKKRLAPEKKTLLSPVKLGMMKYIQDLELFACVVCHFGGFYFQCILQSHEAFLWVFWNSNSRTTSLLYRILVVSLY